MAIPSPLLADMQGTLLAGGYSLFLGAGANYGGKDARGHDLPLGDHLRQELVSLKNLRAGSSLARAYAQLTQGEIDTHLTDRFSNCEPGPSLLNVPAFTWRRIYTLNIDNALEVAYAVKPGHQTPEPKTHKTPYANAADINVVQIVHIHGWARNPNDGYVFSLEDYAGTMGPNSPWTTVLAHTIATEPFIVAGTSLEEPDLEYFLNGRRADSVRRDRGPSFLVEPYPDEGTVRDCERHGLHLYAGTFEEFFRELLAAFPARPLPANATTTMSASLFNVSLNNKERTLFSRDFGYVIPQQVQENADLAFFVGRQPTLTDIALSRDISRSSTIAIKNEIRRRYKESNWTTNFLLFDDNAGEGKSTILMRVVFDLAAEGIPIFQYRNLSSPNLDLCAKFFNAFKQPFVIACDNFGDHVSGMVELHRRISRPDFLIIGVERSYRMGFVLQALVGSGHDRRTLNRFAAAEANDLILKMERYGLTSLTRSELVRQSVEMAQDPIAIAVCRIMNDFRSVRDIVLSLARDASEDRLTRYLACALASYCYKAGISYDILTASFDASDLQKQFNARDILPLSFTDPDTRDYVIPTNPVLGERVLREVSATEPGLIFETCCALGASLAPYVNRGTIVRRTPEARVAARLLDYDDVVIEFIGSRSEEFYLRMKKYWDWNSRYWEQFALLKLDKFLKSTSEDRFDYLTQAISHARHAVQLELHPLSLTTLGRILLEEMRHNPSRAKVAFDEAFEKLDQAIRIERRMNRIAIHPYITLFNGVNHYLKLANVLSQKQTEELTKHMETAEQLFDYDKAVLLAIRELEGRTK